MTITLKVRVIPKKRFRKEIGKYNADWNGIDTITLRKDRKGIKRYNDFIHEMKHVWVDLIDNDR